MNISALSTAVGLVVTLGGGGFWVANTIATKADKEDVLIVATQTQFALDKQIESLLAQINKLEAKKVKTEDDRDQIRYLREEVKRTREIKQGK